MTMTFKVGDMEIHRLIELEAPFLPALDMLPALDKRTLDENRHWLAPHSLDAQDVFILCYQSYLVSTPHHLILIDSCLGNDKPRARPEWHLRRSDRYMASLARLGYGVDDIDFVLCTHLHGDHVGWNTRLENGQWVPTFPKARYVFGREEVEATAAMHEATPIAAYVDSVLPILAANRAELVDSDFSIGDHVRLLPTPGHTTGHVSFCFGHRRDDVVMTGDLLHTPLQMRYPALSFVRDVAPKQAADTRRSFLERYCETSTLCCAAHFPGQSVGRVLRWGDGYRLDVDQ